MKAEKIEAQFLTFSDKSNWVKGKVGKYFFEAKLFDEGSLFGINDGRISKLGIWDEEVRQQKESFLDAVIIHYDRGWDIKPTAKNKPYFDAVYNLLENSPKRFVTNSEPAR